MKKYGGFIPGIRAGKPTEDYLSYVLSRITLPGCALPRPGLADPADRARADQRQPELPVRRHLDPDHGRRRPRHGEADREPAPAAQLRRIPPLDAADHHGPAGGGKGTQAKFIAEHFKIPAISTGDIFRANVSKGTPLGIEAKRYMDAGEYVPDEVTNLMVRDRIDEPDAVTGFLLDGYPRTLAQVEELDGMIKFTGHQLDAVVVLTVDQDEIVERLLQRAQVEGRADDTEDVIRRRQEVYAEQTEPLIEVYREPRHPHRGRRHGRGRRGHPAHLRRARRDPGELTDRSSMGWRDRGVEIKTPEQVAAMRRAGLVVGRTLELLRDAVRPGITHRPSWTAIAEDAHPHRGRDAVVPGLPAASPASICTSVNDEVVHGIPGEPGARRGRPGLDRLRRDRRRLARRRRDHGRRSARSAAEADRAGATSPRQAMWARHRGRPAPAAGSATSRRPSRRTSARQRAATGSSRTTPATASARRCTSRPTCPTSAGRPRRRAWSQGLALAVEPMVTLGSKRPSSLDDDWTVGDRRRQLGGPLRAHLRAHPDRAPGCSPPSTAARRRCPRSASRSAVADARERTGAAGGEYSFAAGSSARAPVRVSAPGPRVDRRRGGGRDLWRSSSPQPRS